MSSGFVLVWLTWLSSCLPLPADYCLVYCIFHGLLLASVLIFDYMPWLQYECLRNCYSRPLALVGKRCCASLICNSLSYCCISAGLLSSSYMFWKQTLWQCCNWTWTSSLIPAIVCLYLACEMVLYTACNCVCTDWPTDCSVCSIFFVFHAIPVIACNLYSLSSSLMYIDTCWAGFLFTRPCQIGNIAYILFSYPALLSHSGL